MRSAPIIASLFFLAAFSSFNSFAQQQQLEFGTLNQIIPGAPVGEVESDGHTATATNGFFLKYGDAVLTADSAQANLDTGETIADGHVRIEQSGMLWVGDHINYNYKTRQMRSEQFRTGRPPVFASGQNLQGDISNQVYTAKHVLITTDDVNHPAVYIRASRFRIVPNQYIEAWNAVLFVDGVPSFYFPYYKRNLG